MRGRIPTIHELRFGQLSWGCKSWTPSSRLCRVACSDACSVACSDSDACAGQALPNNLSCSLGDLAGLYHVPWVIWLDYTMFLGWSGWTIPCSLGDMAGLYHVPWVIWLEYTITC